MPKTVMRSIILIAFVFFYGVTTLSARAAQRTHEPTNQRASTIGYASVSEAINALRAREDVIVTEREGWTIITDNSAHTIWSFTPAKHKAYPAAVKRQFVEKDGKVYVQMNALCQADKISCDELMSEFESLNAKIRDRMAQPEQ